MVVLDKYHDVEDGLTSLSEPGDAPPSYETIAGSGSSRRVGGLDEKSRSYSPGRHPPTSTSTGQPPAPQPPTPGPSSSWLSIFPFTSSRTSTQVRQTVLSLVRSTVLDPSSPNILASCSDACKSHSLDFSSLLQERSIENHTPIYWAIVNECHDVLPPLLGYSAPLTQGTVSEIKLACLASSNERLFQALRCRRGVFGELSVSLFGIGSSSGTDALILGSMPSDEVTIREGDGEGASFVADMRISMWQKRMRVGGRVNVEFIARGRIWSLTFFSAPWSGSSVATSNKAAGSWQVALCLLEHSPPTFIDSRLVFTLPPPPQPPSSVPDLISLSPSHSESSGSTSASTGTSGGNNNNNNNSNHHSSRSNKRPSPSTSKTTPKTNPPSPPSLQLRLKHTHRLAYRSPNVFLAALDAAYKASQRNTAGPGASPPRADQWSEEGVLYTNAILARLDGGACEEVMYDDTKYIGADGSLYARLEARLARPDATECVIC
ncbi:hypothetical protein F5I97DRAFT_1930998 [Phlebopus sp. FC_14]|nr:hypothetical protein F5I97DRAFT_1930998 [Phlebopus sp. FC_14]